MRSTENQTNEKPYSSWIILILAVACGLIAANLYYAQPILGPISSALNLSSGATGFIVTLTQIGYGLGLLFIVPLGDILENRKLVTVSLLLTASVLVFAGLAKGAVLFLVVSLLIGLGSVGAQILVPYAAHLSPEATRGRQVGNVMSGLLLGIMLARPVSSIVTEFLGWRAVYYLSAGLIFALALVLASVLPARKPTNPIRYPALLGSMWQLLKTTPILQRRAIYHAFVFGTFSLFWTTVPMLLTGPMYHFSQKEVALFALVGVSGAVASPVAGRLADKGWIRPATGIALILVIVSMIIPLVVPGGTTMAVIALGLSAILLDMGVSANMVLGQRAIFSLGDDVRSRLNGLYMAIFFGGGAIGSAAGGWAYAMWGWEAVFMLGTALPVLAFIYYATEKKGLYSFLGHGSLNG